MKYKYLFKKDYHIVRGFAHFSFNNEDVNQDLNQDMHHNIHQDVHQDVNQDVHHNVHQYVKYDVPDYFIKFWIFIYASNTTRYKEGADP